MKSPDTIVYEQDSQIALSCFHYESLLCFPMQKRYWQNLKTALYPIYTAIWKLQKSYILLYLVRSTRHSSSHFYCNPSLLTLIYNNHKVPLGKTVHNCKQYFSAYLKWTYNIHSNVNQSCTSDVPVCLATYFHLHGSEYHDHIKTLLISESWCSPERNCSISAAFSEKQKDFKKCIKLACQILTTSPTFLYVMT